MRVLLRSGISRAAAACVLGAVVSVLAIAGSGVRRDEGVQPAVPASGAHPAAPAREPGPEQAPAPISEPVPEPPLRDGVDCAGVFYPLQVSVEPDGDAAPGAVVSATIRVTAARAMGRVELECSAGDGVELLADPAVSAERIAPGETYERRIVARLPQSSQRRVVEVTVRGWIDGARLERSTIWNLVPAGPELSREVLRADGTRVREVPARRIR